MSKVERLCIKVPKVYDWITHQAEKEFQFEVGDIDFFTEEDPEDQTTDTLVDDICDYFLPNSVKVSCVLIAPEPPEELCAEVGDRKDVHVEEYDTVLQLVNIQKQGQFQIVLEAKDNYKNNGLAPLFSEPINFFKIEKFLLCAPPGTDVLCHVYDFDCEGSFVCNGDGTEWTIDLLLLICQSIQVEAEVKIDIEGKICKPRPEILLPVRRKKCPDFKFPEQCPEVFPRPHKPH
ncbi:hypothetical protein CR194_09940 [Salipaludibacillus keqinensis]|uniref:Uncharacterized protein n=1 Tax=Salipaludibacillus keqinensis TaxID=2045207 RepID=A0A323TDK5_9BACI|nr:hypothetical protein [Salipaludibacillus keqinensis]PYZ93482.1 hypothetical protein CR194_09940 [Salipaludibacillus keqinensis]